MKNTKVFLLILSIFLLASCGTKEEGLKIEGSDLKQTNNLSFKVNEEKLVYNEKEKKLSIGDSVVVEEGVKNFPQEIKIYKNAKLYSNSNVPNYAFFVIYNKEEDLNLISNYYISLFKNLGYERVIEQLDENIESEVDNSNLEFVLKNTDYKLDEDGNPIDGEKEFKDRVLIRIHEETPKNIKDGMGLEGRFIEIYYNQN